MRHPIRTLTVLVLLASMHAPGVYASDPIPAGTLSDAGSDVSWTGGPLSGAVLVPEACAAADCDAFALTLDLPADTWTRAGGVQVSIRWADEHDDLDLYIRAPDGEVVASSVGIVSAAEAVTLEEPANGLYMVVVVPADAEDMAYEGRVDVEFRPDVAPLRDLLPDLVSLPATGVTFSTGAYLEPTPLTTSPTGCYPEETVEQGALRCLRFDQAIANLGAGPFEIRYKLDDAAGSQDLVQRIYASDGGHREVRAASWEFHPAHAHFHYREFARSFLWSSNADGDRLGTAPVRAGRKNGFCMIDVDNVWFDRRGGADRTYIPPACLLPTDVNPESGAVAMISGISAGWADVYWSYLADQFIEISGLGDGFYLLETVADPDATVVESDDSNNASTVLIRLCGDSVEVVGAEPGCGA